MKYSIKINHTKVFDFIHSRIVKTTSVAVVVIPIANISILLIIGWLNFLLFIFQIVSRFPSRFKQMLFRILWSFFFSTFFFNTRTVPDVQITRKVIDENNGQNIWMNASFPIPSPEKIITSSCKLHNWYMPNADMIANPKLATKRKCPKKRSLMPPMYLNLVAIAALLAIASVTHKIIQIVVTVPTKIVISANLEYKNKGAIQMKPHNRFFSYSYKKKLQIFGMFYFWWVKQEKWFSTGCHTSSVKRFSEKFWPQSCDIPHLFRWNALISKM